MANKYIEYIVNDTTFEFRLSLRAQMRIEKHFKKPFGKIDYENMSIEDFVYMIWATMKDSSRESMSFVNFLNFIDEHLALKEIYELFGEITVEAFGKNVMTPQEETEIVTDPEELVENGIGIAPYQTLS